MNRLYRREGLWEKVRLDHRLKSLDSYLHGGGVDLTAVFCSKGMLLPWLDVRVERFIVRKDWCRSVIPVT